jgi:predicted GNAT family N-acyltransferase
MASQDQAIKALELAQIVAYYRNRVDAFEADRTSFYTKLDSIRLRQELVHRVEWDLKKRLDEKAALQTALDQCQ